MELCLLKKYIETSVYTLNGGFAIHVRKKANLSFKVLRLLGWALIDATAIDFLDRTNRIRLVYIFKKKEKVLYLSQNIKLRTPVQSATSEYSAAVPLEREMYEMFSIIFTGHPDLRKLLLDYSFVGNPLLKDYPLTGFTQIKFNSQKVLNFKALEMVQELRIFSFPQVWINNK